MGNYRFKLSNMIPNAWFYKLKDMSKTGRNHNKSPSFKKKQPKSTPQPNQLHLSNPRKSYNFTTEPKFYNFSVNPKTSNTHFPDPPRKSLRRRAKRRTIRSSSKIFTSSVYAGCSCRAPLMSSPEHEDLHENYFQDQFGSSSSNCRVISSETDIIIDLGEKSNGFDSIAELELPPILTKPVKFNDMVNKIKKKETTIEATKFRRSSAKLEEKIAKEERPKNHKKQRSSQASSGIKLRSNSPRIASRKIQSYSRKSISSSTSSRLRRKSLSESFAVVKSSFNPQKDFRDSMVEMILENNIRASKDLEELLACYLSLNSDEYHDLIVNVFEQIWLEMTDIQL